MTLRIELPNFVSFSARFFDQLRRPCRGLPWWDPPPTQTSDSWTHDPGPAWGGSLLPSGNAGPSQHERQEFF
jgi:hypothetical protein